MPEDRTPSRVARRLTTTLVALVIASIATAATAAGALAAKEPPTVVFDTATPACDYLGDRVRAVVDLGFDGRGRWVYVEAKAVATDAAGNSYSGHLFDSVKYDMKTFTPTPGVPVSTSHGPVTTRFYVRPLDRRGTPLQPVWSESDPYTCQ